MLEEIGPAISLFFYLLVIIALPVSIIILIVKKFDEHSGNNAFTDDLLIAGNPDFNIATAQELRSQSLVNYKEKFGAVPDEKTAISIAEKVLDEIYEDCSKTEQPFEVTLNTNANAWIVNNTLPLDTLGGTGYIAIEKDTGEILLLIHYQ